MADKAMLLNVGDSESEVEEFKLPPAKNRKPRSKPRRQPLEARVAHGTSYSLLSLKCFATFFTIALLITGALLFAFFVINTQQQLNDLKSKLLKMKAMRGNRGPNIGKLSSEVDKVQKDLKSMTVKENKLEKQIIEAANKDSSKEILSLQRQLKLLSEDISSLKDGMARSGSELSKMSEQLDQQKDAADGLAEDLGDLKQKTSSSQPLKEYITLEKHDEMMKTMRDQILNHIQQVVKQIQKPAKQQTTATPEIVTPATQQVTREELQQLEQKIDHEVNNLTVFLGGKIASMHKEDVLKMSPATVANEFSALESQIDSLNLSMLAKMDLFNQTIEKQHNQHDARYTELYNETKNHLTKFSEEFYPDLVGEMTVRKTMQRLLRRNSDSIRNMDKEVKELKSEFENVKTSNSLPTTTAGTTQARHVSTNAPTTSAIPTEKIVTPILPDEIMTSRVVDGNKTPNVVLLDSKTNPPVNVADNAVATTTASVLVAVVSNVQTTPHVDQNGKVSMVQTAKPTINLNPVDPLPSAEQKSGFHPPLYTPSTPVPTEEATSVPNLSEEKTTSVITPPVEKVTSAQAPTMSPDLLKIQQEILQRIKQRNQQQSNNQQPTTTPTPRHFWG